MKAIVKACVVVALGLTILVSTTMVSVALDDYLSKPHCKCTCAASSGNAKELGWVNTGSGNSNAKSCSFTVDGGKHSHLGHCAIARNVRPVTLLRLVSSH